MRVERWERLGVKAEAGLVVAQQQGRTVRFEAIGVGLDAVDAG
jgi:hypothetical protein